MAYTGAPAPLTVGTGLWEQMRAAIAAGYRPHEFEQLEPRWQERVVAMYRVGNRIEAMVSWWSQQKAERRARSMANAGEANE